MLRDRKKIMLLKMFTLPKAIYIFNAIPTKNLLTFFTEIEKKNPKSYMDLYGVTLSFQILRKKNEARGITLSDFKLY